MATIAELRAAMAMLAEDSRVVFIGQSVAYPGQRAHETFADVPMEQRIEMPIAEDFTLGFAIGMSMAGFLPVVFIPRWDFLLCAANQLINHLDAIGERYGARVIVRTAVGASQPLDPGPQHTRDCSSGFQNMFRSVRVIPLLGDPKEVYLKAFASKFSCIVVERMSDY